MLWTWQKWSPISAIIQFFNFFRKWRCSEVKSSHWRNLFESTVICWIVIGLLVPRTSFVNLCKLRVLMWDINIVIVHGILNLIIVWFEQLSTAILLLLLLTGPTIIHVPVWSVSQYLLSLWSKSLSFICRQLLFSSALLLSLNCPSFKEWPQKARDIFSSSFNNDVTLKLCLIKTTFCNSQSFLTLSWC